MARHPHQLYFRNNSFLFFLFPRGVWMCSPPQNYAVMFPTSGWTSRVKHTPTATEETPRANSLPHHAVSLARQLLHNRAWLRELLSLHNVALSSSWGCHYQVETMRERDVASIHLALWGFRITSGEKCSNPVSPVAVNHANAVVVAILAKLPPGSQTQAPAEAQASSFQEAWALSRFSWDYSFVSEKDRSNLHMVTLLNRRSNQVQENTQGTERTCINCGKKRFCFYCMKIRKDESKPDTGSITAVAVEPHTAPSSK